MRYALILIFSALPGIGLSQGTPDLTPRVTISAPTKDVVVGQPADIRIQVLVPTFMPSPPVFPTLEQENLLVRLPERASGPVSESIDGATWSGVQRRYRVYPLTQGEVRFPAQDMTVTYADPETNAPVQVSVPLQAIAFNAVVPEAARDLAPLIVATGFELSQDIEGSTEMQTGGAITRRLTARIDGASPLMIPVLITENQTDTLRSYPKEPRFSETEERGILSGQRVDEITYVAQDSGQTQLPPVTVQWFNLSSNSVETATTDAVEITVAAAGPGIPSLQDLLRYGFWVVGVAVAVGGAFRVFGPRIGRWRQDRAERYRASARYAGLQLGQALRDQDLTAAYSALEVWKARCRDPQGYRRLEGTLSDIGAARYARDGHDETAAWSSARTAQKRLRDGGALQQQPLPPLNP